jgi:hypothetical protein
MLRIIGALRKIRHIGPLLLRQNRCDRKHSRSSEPHDQPDHPVEPFDFIIFGGPATSQNASSCRRSTSRQCDHQFSEPTRIIGASRSKMTDKEFQEIRREGDQRTRQEGRTSRKMS